MSEMSSSAGADTASTSAPGKSTVSMRKPTRGSGAGSKRAPRPPAVKVTPPLLINIVTAALVAMVVGNIARGLLLLGSTPTLQAFVTHANATAKKPDKTFTPSDVAKAVHTLREGALIQAVIFGIALLLLAYAMRNSRSASGTRWAVLIIFVYTAMPFYVIPTSGLPPAAQAAGVLIGVSSILAILLIFIPPQSQKYFRDCREVNTPADMRGKPRGGLAGLFGPKRQRGQPPARSGGFFGGAGGARGAGGMRGAGTANRPTPAAETTPRPGTAKAKAKVRSDTDAIAKGAELARSRAKASKSRRTSD